MDHRLHLKVFILTAYPMFYSSVIRSHEQSGSSSSSLLGHNKPKTSYIFIVMIQVFLRLWSLVWELLARRA